MLKTTQPEVPMNADPAPEARPATKRRRPKAASASRCTPAVQMPGVDVFGKVTHAHVFSTMVRNERRMHQVERSNTQGDVRRTQQQAQLAAEAAQAHSTYLAGGLRRVQAYRDAVGVVGSVKTRAEAQTAAAAHDDEGTARPVDGAGTGAMM